jgi:hypothetical protein
VLQSWDAAGAIHKRGVDVTVQSQAVVVTSPAPNAVVGTSVAVKAKGNGTKSVTMMQLYVDGVSQFQNKREHADYFDISRSRKTYAVGAVVR